MSTLRRMLAVARVHARELGRRHIALLLLVGLPIAFYGSLAGHTPHAIGPGTIATAFSISGAGIFTLLAARPVDQRLVLAGYRPGELVIGRLVFLAAISLPILAGTDWLMVTVSHPARPAALIQAVALMGVVAVPLGVLIGMLLPRELEATLVLIGIVGVQLTIDPTLALAKALPFYAARQLIEVALGNQPTVPATTTAGALAYALALTAIAVTIGQLRMRVLAPDRITDAEPVTDRRDDPASG